jgi:hypothetical protein
MLLKLIIELSAMLCYNVKVIVLYYIITIKPPKALIIRIIAKIASRGG